ncbi:MAG: DUF4430 domain-containing protein [Patescibacteria group bacterium]|nr:DUF4430 domain-containing protein [Patescibacteria group bacterium]
MKKPLLDKPTRYRIELLVILLIISVAGNIGLYYLNKWYYAENFSSENPPASPSPHAQAGSAQITLLIPGTPPATIEAKLQPQSSVLDLLDATHTIIASGEAGRMYVYSINGTSANPARNEYWSFSVNGTPADRNPEEVYVKPNDRIVWEIKRF